MQTARIWREIPQRYRLEASKCDSCSKIHYPPRLVCDACGNRQFSPVRLSSTGKVVTHTTIHSAQSAFVNQLPLLLAVVELEEGVRIMAQLADISPEDLRTGMAVRLEFRKIRQDGLSGVISYGHKAVPASVP